MAWIGLCTEQIALFDPGGIPSEGEVPPMPPMPATDTQLVSRGTLMIEADFIAGSGPQMVLDYRRNHPWETRLSLQFAPDGMLTLDIQRAGVSAVSHLPTGLRTGSCGLRVTYGWDAPARTACLSVYDPTACMLWQQILPAPQPFVLDDLRLLIKSAARRHLGRDVQYLAVSDKIEPVGPQPGLASHAVIETPTGPAPIGRLRPGEPIFTSEAAAEPLLLPVARDLPAFGQLRPMRLRSPYFGLSRDLVVSAETQILCQGPDVEYLFGEEAVLVRAGDLEDSKMVLPVIGMNVMRYHQLICAEHEVLWVAGARVASQYMGRVGLDPIGAATSLLAAFELPQAPIHFGPAYPVLKGYEAVTLNAARAA